MPNETHLGFYLKSGKGGPLPQDSDTHVFEVHSGVKGKFDKKRVSAWDSVGANLVRERAVPRAYRDEMAEAKRKTRGGTISRISYSTRLDKNSVVSNIEQYDPKLALQVQQRLEEGKRIEEHRRLREAGLEGLSIREILHAPRRARGFGFFIEYFCTLHLKQLGVTHVEQKGRVSKLREDQLKSVGLELRKPYPIDVWIARMKEGFQAGLRKQRIALRG